MFKLNLFTLFILLIFSIKTFALESTDVMKTQILKIYDKNVLVLNRGVEDGVTKNDHIKMTSSDGFIARGICIQTSMLASHWKIYRVVRPELVSQDTLYKMVTINQSQWPKDMAKLKAVDFSKYFANEEESNREKKVLKMQKERIARYDLPDSLDSIPRKNPVNHKFDKYIEKKVQASKIKKENSQTFINFFASPISWQSRLDQKETHFGVKVHNIDSSILYRFKAQKSQRKVVDPVTQVGYESESNYTGLGLDYYKISENVFFTSEFSSSNEKIGETYYPREYNQLGFLGLKYALFKEKRETFSISYIPMLDQISYSKPGLNDETSSRSGLRHRIRIALKSNWSPTVKNITEIVYAPYLDLDSNKSDYADTNTHIRTQLSYKVAGQFYTDYIFDYQNDKLRSELYNVSQDNTTQTLRFRYQFDL